MKVFRAPCTKAGPFPALLHRNPKIPAMPHYPVESGVRSDMSSRVKVLREKLNIRQAELARWLGVSRSYITHMEKGKPCSYPVQKLIERLEAEAAGREHRMKWRTPETVDAASDLAPYQPASSAPIESEPEPPPCNIPLLTMSEACTLGDADEAPQLTHQHVAFNVADSHAFAVRVHGDAMQPQHVDGELAIVYPSEAPHTGDRVLARLHDGNGGTVLFRIFNVVDRGHQIVLSSPNPAYPPLQYRRQDFAWIHPVAATLRQLR
jgi:SOS-response transcriptional repressor LexA